MSQTTEEPRDVKGRFAKGNSGGPGRPKGSTKYEFVTLCRRMAEKEGLDLDNAVWSVVKSMFKKSLEGDVAAARLIIERFCGKAPEAEEIVDDGWANEIIKKLANLPPPHLN